MYKKSEKDSIFKKIQARQYKIALAEIFRLMVDLLFKLALTTLWRAGLQWQYVQDLIGELVSRLCLAGVCDWLPLLEGLLP